MDTVENKNIPFGKLPKSQRDWKPSKKVLPKGGKQAASLRCRSASPARNPEGGFWHFVPGLKRKMEQDNDCNIQEAGRPKKKQMRVYDVVEAAGEIVYGHTSEQCSTLMFRLSRDSPGVYEEVFQERIKTQLLS